MALDAVRDSIDDLPDMIKSEYKEKDGKYILCVTEVNGYALEDVSGLRNTLKKFKTEHQSVKSQLERFKGIDPEKAKQAMERASELELYDPSKEIQEKVSEFKKKTTAAHLKEINSWKEKLDVQTKAVHKYVREKDIANALAQAKVNPKLFKPYIAPRTKVVQDETTGAYRTVIVDDSGQEELNNAGEPMSITDYLERMRSDQDYAALFPSQVLSGTGGTPPTASRRTISSGVGSVKFVPASEAHNYIEQIAKGEVQVKR